MTVSTIEQSVHGARSGFDPITLEVIAQELIAIPNQIDKNITRTAFSAFISEYKDYSVGIVDATGALISQSRGSLAIFVANALGTAVRDGLSNTLMLGENCRTGVDAARPAINWATGDGRQSRLFFSHTICRDNSCTAAAVDFTRANQGDHAINAGRNMAEGESPFLNSFHPGGVNIALGDGSVRFLSDQIDGRVLYHLFTPDGNGLRNTPLDAGVADGNF